VAWLLDGMGTEVAMPRGRLYIADTEDWLARIECVSANAEVDVYLNDIHARRMVRVAPMNRQSTPCVVGHVTIDGAFAIENPDGRGLTAISRQTVLYQPSQPIPHLFKARTRLRSVGYKIDCTRLEQMLGGDPPAVLRTFLDGTALDGKLIEAPNNRLLRNVARQLFMPGLNGPLRRLMMEGLVSQLLALQVMAASQTPTRRRRSLTSRQRTAVQEARERLVGDMRNPPSLGEVAAAVGLTQKKLNAGFRELFGATAFEILRDERLEHARRALEERALSLKEVSFRVGYEHVSNFVHAFRDRFGAPPAQYLANLQNEKQSRSTEHPSKLQTA
jgi:AraC-like DNA-binding protein